MVFPPANAQPVLANHHGTVVPEARPSLALEGDFERVARRRYQHPKPFREGNYWWIKLWTHVFVAGIVDEHLRPINQNSESIGSATIDLCINNVMH